MYTRVHASFRSPHVSVVLLQVQMEFVVRDLTHLREPIEPLGRSRSLPVRVASKTLPWTPVGSP